jgi:hypothetical protein
MISSAAFQISGFSQKTHRISSRITNPENITPLRLTCRGFKVLSVSHSRPGKRSPSPGESMTILPGIACLPDLFSSITPLPRWISLI